MKVPRYLRFPPSSSKPVPAKILDAHARTFKNSVTSDASKESVEGIKDLILAATMPSIVSSHAQNFNICCGIQPKTIILDYLGILVLNATNLASLQIFTMM